jgi:hypothetical protein
MAGIDTSSSCMMLCRLAGYDPVLQAPLEVLEARLKEAEDPLHQRHGHRRTPRQGQHRGHASRSSYTGNTALMPGVVRLTGAGYIGDASNIVSRIPVLTLQQQELFVKLNDQVLVWHPARFHTWWRRCKIVDGVSRN